MSVIDSRLVIPGTENATAWVPTHRNSPFGVPLPASDPPDRVNVPPIVEYLGRRGKIYQIHMRNIRGRLYDFEEVYPDEGEMNFFEIMRILRDTGFAGSICPDHMPHHADDPKSLQAFAFGYGYLRALIQAVNSEIRA